MSSKLECALIKCKGLISVLFNFQLDASKLPPNNRLDDKSSLYFLCPTSARNRNLQEKRRQTSSGIA